MTEVTVVIPVWDRPYVEALPRAVASVRAQDPAVPVVVVDNASRAQVPVVEGTTVVRAPERLTAGAARNLGLEAVKTEFVIFLDADDELLDGALGLLREGIALNPGVAAFAMSLTEADTGRRHRFPPRFASSLSRRTRPFAVATMLWSLYSTGCAILRTDSVREAGGFSNLTGPEDWALNAALAFRRPVRVDARPALVYHRRDDSVSGTGIPSRDLLEAAGEVRARLRADPAVPRWVKAAMPLTALVHTCLILACRPIYRAARRSRLHNSASPN